MKKRGIKLIAGLVTAGMLAATGFVGIQTIGGITTTETIEYKMEENEAGYDISSIFTKRADNTAYPYLSGLEKSLPKGTRYVRVNTYGYNKPVLVVFPTDSDSYAKLYTEKSGRNVRCIGEIRTNMRIVINNGIFYTFNDTDQYRFREMSFYISSDGNGYIVKDYIDATPNGKGCDFYGFFNHDGYGNADYINGYDQGDAVHGWFCKYYNNGQDLYGLCKTR